MPSGMRALCGISMRWNSISFGGLTLILDDLLSLGINGLHPIEPGPTDLEIGGLK